MGSEQWAKRERRPRLRETRRLARSRISDKSHWLLLHGLFLACHLQPQRPSRTQSRLSIGPGMSLQAAHVLQRTSHRPHLLAVRFSLAPPGPPHTHRISLALVAARRWKTKGMRQLEVDQKWPPLKETSLAQCHPTHRQLVSSSMPYGGRPNQKEVKKARDWCRVPYAPDRTPHQSPASHVATGGLNGWRSK